MKVWDSPFCHRNLKSCYLTKPAVTWPIAEWNYTHAPKCWKNHLLHRMNKRVTTVGGLVATRRAEADRLWAAPLRLSVLLLEGEL